MSNRVFVTLFGPICSGKTSVAKILHKKMPRTFLISNDRLKWLISDYRAHTEEDRPTVSLMVFDVTKRAFQYGLNVIRDGNYHRETPEQIKMYKELIDQQNIKNFNFNLEASLPILLNRLRERIERAERDGAQLVVKNEELYMCHYNLYEQAKSDFPTFDTELLTVDQIADKILEIINAQS